ncbi:MAG: hypothetical protein R2722_02165 [Tessaracoccus sp.]
MLADRGPRMLQAYDEGGAEVRSRIDIFTKDMGIVNSAAREQGLATPIAAAPKLPVPDRPGRRPSSWADDSSVIKVVAPHRKGDARRAPWRSC